MSGENPEGDEADEDGDEDGVVDEGGELDGYDEDTEDACVGEDDKIFFDLSMAQNGSQFTDEEDI